MITVGAHAKINFVLEVLGKREDNYHEIVSIMQTVSLKDVLTFEDAEDISLNCDVRGLGNSDNLVQKAAELLKMETGIKQTEFPIRNIGVLKHLTCYSKNIFARISVTPE